MSTSGGWEGKWLILLADETQGVHIKLCYLLTMHAVPECLIDVYCTVATNRYYLSLHFADYVDVNDVASDTGKKLPERCIFSQLLNIAAVICKRTTFLLFISSIIPPEL